LRTWKDERTGAVAYAREWGGGRVAVLSALGASLAREGKEREAETAWTEAERVIHSIENISDIGSDATPSIIKMSEGRAEAFSMLGVALALAGEKKRAETIWTEMEQMILLGKGGWQNIKVTRSEGSFTSRAGSENWNEGMGEALLQIAVALIHAKEWERAETVIRWIAKDGRDFSRLERQTLRELEDALVKAEQWKRLMEVRARTEEHLRAQLRAWSPSSGMQLRADVDQLLPVLETKGDSGIQAWEQSLVAISRLSIEPAACWPEHSEQSGGPRGRGEKKTLRAEVWSPSVVKAEWSSMPRGRGNLKGTLRGEVWTYPREFTNTRGWVRKLVVRWEATAQGPEEHLKQRALLSLGDGGRVRSYQDAKEDPAIRESLTYRELPDLTLLWSSQASSHDEEEENTDDEEEQGPCGDLWVAGAQEEWEQARALKEQVVALAQSRKWEQAQKLIQTIRKNALKQQALQDLGKELMKAQEWARAEAVIRSLEWQEERVRALADFGLALSKEHNRERAEGVWAEVEKIIPTLVWSDAQTKALYGLGKAYIEAQEWERAEKTIRTIEWNEERRKALYELGIALTNAQEWDLAERVIQSIDEGEEKSPWRDDALYRLGIALAEAREWEQAEAMVRSIEWDEERAKALRELGLILARAQEWERAGRVARSIEESYRRPKPLEKRSMLLSRQRLWKEVEDLIRLQQWEQAEALIRSTRSNWIQVQALCELAMQLAKAHKWEWAETIIRSIGEDSSWEREQALGELGKMLAREEKLEQAERVISSIVECEKERVEALCELAIALTRVHNWERAVAVINEIDEDAEEKDRALSELAVCLAKAQQWERAIEVSYSIDSDEEKAWMLWILAQNLAEAGEDGFLLSIVQDSWTQASTRKEAIQSLPLATGFIPLKAEIGTALYEAFTWVDTFLKG
jgi:tetratricopeptide (TPR) repeat protein